MCKDKYIRRAVFLVLALLNYTLMLAQSGSFGNIHIDSGGEMSIIDVQHNFINGGDGVQPGIISTVRVAPRGYLSFVGTASHTSISNAAHVDGYVRTYETGVFTFPIGDNGKLRTASVSAASNSIPADAAYYNVNPTTDSYTSTSVDAGVIAVSTIEYWDINGPTAAKITLTWDSSSGVTSLATTKIVGWDGTKWVNVPATFVGGSTTTTGSIITDNTITPNTYTVYTLAGIGVLPCNAGTVAPVLTANSKTNTCPATTVDLTTITATNLPSGSITLTWHTATPATTANKVATPSSVGAGTYFATFFDATNNCYASSGSATTPVVAVVGSCTSVDLTTSTAQPSPSPVAGQPSNLPVTVSNIGSAPTTGLITETVAIPTGTSFGTFLTASNNNGWACTSLTATTASCTNSNSIIPSGNSTFNVPFIPTPAQVGTPLTVPPATVSGGGEPSTNNGNNASAPVTTPNVTSANGLLTVKALLQGPLSTTTMTTALNPTLIPLTDPYSKGTTTTGIILTTNSITDWVLVELRSASASGTVSESIAALIKNDGTLLNSDGTTPLKFGTSSGNFYVAVRHRNHLGVMTAAPVAMSTTTTNIDFTNPSTATYGNTITTPAQKTVGGLTAMWAGNATGISSSNPDNVRQTTLTSDAVAVTNKIASAGGGTAIVSGYFATDLNLDGNTRQSTLASDRLIITNNISTHPGNVTGAKTFIITQLF